MYVWNGFNIIGKRVELLEAMLVVVERTVNTILEQRGTVGCWGRGRIGEKD